MADRHVCAGGIVYRPGEEGWEVLLILDQFGRWALPKGRVEPGETTAAAAVREVLEETGVAAELGELIGQTVYTTPPAAGGGERIVHYYLMTAPAGAAAAVPAGEEVQDACWMPLGEATTTVGYGNVRALLAVAAVRIPDIGQKTKEPAR